MDTIEEILRRLSNQGLVDGYQSISEQMRESLVTSGVLYAGESALERIDEENQRYLKELTNLSLGYGLRTATDRILEEQDLAVRLALSNSYANLTGTQFLAERELLSQQALVDQLEAIVSPTASMKSALADLAVPSSIEQAIRSLDVSGHLIGEFAFQGGHEQDSSEEEGDAEESPIREEVGSRIIQVNYFPQKLFEAIRNEPKLMKGLHPREFEEFTAELLGKLGFSAIQLTSRSGDGGRDVVATIVVNEIPIIMGFECKQYNESNKIGPDILRALLGSVAHGPTKASKGVLVTTSSFTAGARTFMAAEALIDGKDFNGLVRWLQIVGSSDGG